MATATAQPFFTWRRSMTDSDLPSTTKLVLFVLAEYANAMDDIMWPSLETLASRASLSVRAVGKHLALAADLGWLTSWKSRRPGRQWAHGHYRLSVPADVALRQRDAIEFDIASCESERGAERDAPKSERGAGHGAGEPERRADPDSVEAFRAVESESYRNDVPTSKPVNRNTKKPSLSHTSAVNEGTGCQREKTENRAGSMARWMFGKLRAEDRGIAEPDFGQWARDIDAMQADDGRGEQEIVRLFGWAIRDRFWRNIVTGPARLRKHWDELRRRRNAALDVARVSSSGTPTTAGLAASAASPALADDRQCAHETNGCRCTHTATIFTGAGQSRRGYCRDHIGYHDE
ncbi:helix-turn-helix domain-containing protein [Burkholderia vietnamiensis]|uniref:helix-turn-helix domain-containing protein n=1 Tax=Burkholderia vietnamiensis TaxID=60552 RepID=UPI0018C898F7|nr:helix-turn-helix domain-containing protein [Burkholderia vietnamiensis]